MLIIQPIGGLCNRMRAINSAKVLAHRRGEPLKVIWNVNAELGCPFEALFETPKGFQVRSITSKWDPVKLFYQLTRSSLGNEDIRRVRTDGNLPDEYAAALPKRLYIATEEHFFVNHDYSDFVPAQKLHEQIAALCSGFSSHNVGVHIRRTDNKPAIGKSSTDAFVASMRRALEHDPDTMFYLATDDMREEAHLRELFGDRIISNETRDLSRDSINGIRDALIDLMCLSKTDRIIGSYFSSFTDIAADLSGIPKLIAGEDA